MFDFERKKIRFMRGGKYPQSNTVLIDDSIHTVIDPACDEQKLLSIHEQRPIELIINSHGHEDHFQADPHVPEPVIRVQLVAQHNFQFMGSTIAFNCFQYVLVEL